MKYSRWVVQFEWGEERREERGPALDSICEEGLKKSDTRRSSHSEVSVTVSNPIKLTPDITVSKIW